MERENSSKNMDNQTTQPLLNTIIQNAYNLVQYVMNEKWKYHLNKMATICYMRMILKNKTRIWRLAFSNVNRLTDCIHLLIVSTYW